jgi:hypothetical protein
MLFEKIKRIFYPIYENAVITGKEIFLTKILKKSLSPIYLEINFQLYP